MLLGGLVDDFEQTPQMGINLAYFFCQATDSRINTAAAVIGGLIVSFLKQHHELRSYIHTEYKDDLDKLNGPDRWYMLRDVFEKVTQHPTLPNPVCVVDALDECDQDYGCKQLLRLIIDTSCRVKWLISSRNTPGIERQLQEVDSSRRLSLELKGNAEYVTKSVDLYIDNSIQNIVALKGDEELFIKATDTLKSKANGTFLWVALVIEQLRDTEHRNVEAVLDEIPEGLDNLYDLILKQLAKQEDKDVYQILLSTVTASKRPLRLEELLTFISSLWKNYKPTYTIRDIQDIVKDCGSFLSIRDNTVYFIHQSVKDYMIGSAVKVIFPSGIEYQHYQMFTTSLNAMSRILKHNIYGLKDPGSGMDTISPPNPDPLAPIAYCCVFWVEHLFQSCESGASRDKIFLKDDRILHSFLKVKFLSWLESLALLRSPVTQGTDAIQKLKDLLSGYHRSKPSRRNISGLKSSRRKIEKISYQFIRRYKDLYLGSYIKCAFTTFRFHDNLRLRKFIIDAYQFFHRYQHCVFQYPLQLYHSAIIFEDTHSAIFTTFHHIIHAEFKNTFSSITMPKSGVSLVQNINCGSHIIALLYSPDSSLLCSLSYDGTITLCRTDTYSVERVIKLDLDKKCTTRYSPNLPHHLLAFSANSEHLISISSTGVVQVWAIDCGTQVQNVTLNLSRSLIPPPQGSENRARSVLQEEVIALSYHGDLAASTHRTLSSTMMLVKLWTIKAGECIMVIDRSETLSIELAIFSPNLRMIALIDGEDTRVYSVQTGNQINCMPATGTYGMRSEGVYSQFSPDSKLLALKRRSDLYLWSAEAWTMVRHTKCKFLHGKIGFSPDAAIFVNYRDDRFILESTDTGETLLDVKAHTWRINPIFSPDWTDSSLLASFSEDTIQIWRVCLDIRDQTSRIRNLTRYSRGVTISPKSKYVAVWDYGGDTEIWSGESGECIRVLKGKNHAVPFPVFSPDLVHVACRGYGGDIRIWNVETGKLLHLLKGPEVAVIMDFSNDSRYIVASYGFGQVKVWCVSSGTCLYEENSMESYHRRFAHWLAAFSAGSEYIATAFTDIGASICVIRVLDWRTGQCIFRTELDCPVLELRKFPVSSAFVTSLTFSSDATVLVIITDAEAAYGPYEADFYDIASGAWLSYVDIGESNCLPYFDPAKDHIICDRSMFCRRSSWDHWDTIPQPAYSYDRPRYRGYSSGSRWIYSGKHKAFLIPRHIEGTYTSLSISNSLLAFTNYAGEVVIIKLPNRYHIEQ